MSSTLEAPQALSTAEPPAASRNTLELLSLLVLAREHRGWLAKITVIGLVAATAIAFLIPKQYESTAQVLPPDPQVLSGTTALGVMAGITLPTGPAIAAGLAARTPGATCVGILQSRTVQDSLIARFDLLHVYSLKYEIDARKKLAKRSAIEEDRRTGIISITVADNDPQRARELARAYVEELDKLVAKLSASAAGRERAFLENRLQSVKADLDATSRQLSDFSSRNATLNIQEQAKTTIEAAAKLQGELIAAESELRGLQAMYTGENVRVQTMQARVGELRRELHRLSGGGDQTAGAELKADELYPSLRKLPLLSVNYYDLYRQYKMQETIYEILNKQYEVSKIQEVKETPVVKLLDDPELPEKKSFPPRMLIMLFGTALALIGGMAWLVAGELWRATDDNHPFKLMIRELLHFIGRRRNAPPLA